MHRWSQRVRLRHFVRSVLGVAVASTAPLCPAQVVLDGTLGPAGALAGPDFAVGAHLGRQLGGNLFHSFSAFNIANGQSAVFTGPASVQNIMARVTGGSASTIDGRLRSEIPAANFYLINPAGVMFGPNASLDIGGSFHASTADYLRLGADGRFAASQPAASVLSVAPPAAFGFLSAAPARIELNGTRLTTTPGATLSLIGGDVVARTPPANAGRGTQLTARGGTLNVVGVGSPGEVIPAAPDLGAAGFAQLGTVDLLPNTTLDVAAAADAGRIVIRGGQVRVSGARLDAWSYADGRGGAIDIVARDALAIGGSGSDDAGHAHPSRLLTVNQGTLDGRGISLSADTLLVTDQALVQSTTVGAGASGPIRLSARDVTVEGRALVSSGTRGSGRSGDIAIAASHALTIAGEVRIQNVSSGSGNSGDLNLTAERIAIGGDSVVQNQALASGNAGALSATADVMTLEGASRIVGHTHGAGAGAAISLSAREMTLRQASWIGSDTTDSGRGGDVAIAAREHLTIDASHVTASRHASGEGGRIAIDAGALVLDHGAQVSAVAFTGSPARGGDIELHAQSVLLTGGSAILSRSDSAGAGRIEIRAPTVAIVDGAGVHVQSAGDGAGAPIVLDAARLTLQNGGWVASESGRLQGGVLQAGRGDGGFIMITASEVVAASGVNSGIVTITRGEGDAGAVHVVAPTLTLGDSASIASHTAGSGRAGAIVLEVGTLSLAGGSIENSSALSSVSGGPTGSTGPVSINATGAVALSGSARVSALTLGAGESGRIGIVADVLELRDDAFVSSQSFGSGDAGPVAIDVRVLAASGTPGSPAIATRTYASGRAGDIAIAAREAVSLTDVGVQSATRGNGDAGNITIVAPALLVSGSAVETLTIAAGGAGKIVVASERVELTAGARLASASGGTNLDTGAIDVGMGAAGDVIVEASESVILQGQSGGGHASGLYSQTLGAGAAGRVIVTTPLLVLLDGARISAGTADAGDTGSVQVNVQALSLSGGSAIIGAGSLVVFMDVAAQGSLTIQAAQNATMADASLAVVSPPEDHPVDSDTITLSANSIVIFKDDALSWSSAGQGDPATFTLATASTSIIAQAGAMLAVAALAVAGNNIVLSAPRAVRPRDDAVTPLLAERAHVVAIVLDHPVVALPAQPPPPPVVTTPDITPPPAPDPVAGGGSSNNAPDRGGDAPQGTTPGGITLSIVQPPYTRSSGELGAGGLQFVDASRLLTEACGARGAPGNPSSFVVGGQGGLPRQPGEGLLASFLDLESDGLWPATRESATPTLTLKCARS